MEERIERLENLVSLQDRTIEKLSDTVYDQQKQITDLRKVVERLAGKLRDIDEALDQSGGVDTPPPHYNG
ncbi:SlyX protein [Pseudodesulfovibrio cashew]|uniref:SlyX protein n=1 Tax=Pseudodesulfovibrio cashew TaxID=2678688 RepID=A0A6I6JAC9_9BACT|nr:SlyX family protein [Pseudodesulfovibrio cashew]QGY39716.1 SlyX protein [Pseudodesulfovibrio cashew]